VVAARPPACLPARLSPGGRRALHRGGARDVGGGEGGGVAGPPQLGDGALRSLRGGGALRGTPHGAGDDSQSRGGSQSHGAGGAYS
jgi:hypothetical protein